MRVGCYQCECRPEDFDANLVTMREGMELAQQAGLDVVAFPECLLTGYFVREERAQKTAFAVDSPQVRKVLETFKDHESTYMVGFNELRDGRIYDTVMVAEKGVLLGTYSKAFPVFPYLAPGRSFPVFERCGVKFGVIICADGAYIEPARILALKGARVIFAPHYNHLLKEWVVIHHMMVRADHVARAVENGVWFLRANTVGGAWDAGLEQDGVGYGDSYLLDPLGQVVAHAGLHCARLMVGTIDLERNFHRQAAWESRTAARELGQIMLEAAGGE